MIATPLLLGIDLLALSAAQLMGSVIGYRKRKSTVERISTSIAVVGGAAILSTIALGAVEVLPNVAVWPLMLAELGILGTLFWIWMLSTAPSTNPAKATTRPFE